jgi:hypothetical protein
VDRASRPVEGDDSDVGKTGVLLLSVRLVISESSWRMKVYSLLQVETAE